jgi:hypothetical protein
MMKKTGFIIVFICMVVFLSAADLDPKKLKKSGPITYGKDDDAFISGRYIKAESIGVISTSASTVTLERCYIVAGKYGIKCDGGGDVYIKNCYVEGFKSAVLVSGAGDVYISGSKIAGRILVEGEAADFHDNGGNRFYFDAKDMLGKFITASSKYVMGLNNLEEASTVAKALNKCSQSMKPIAEGLKKIKNKYPELSIVNRCPKELKSLMDNTNNIIKKLKRVPSKVKKFADDPAVKEALKKYKEVIAVLK